MASSPNLVLMARKVSNILLSSRLSVVSVAAVSFFLTVVFFAIWRNYIKNAAAYLCTMF